MLSDAQSDPRLLDLVYRATGVDPAWVDRVSQYRDDKRDTIVVTLHGYPYLSWEYEVGVPFIDSIVPRPGQVQHPKVSYEFTAHQWKYLGESKWERWELG